MISASVPPSYPIDYPDELFIIIEIMIFLVCLSDVSRLSQ